MTFRRLKWVAFSLALAAIAIFVVDIALHSILNAVTATLLFITNVLSFFSNRIMEQINDR